MTNSPVSSILRSVSFFPPPGRRFGEEKHHQRIAAGQVFVEAERPFEIHSRGLADHRCSSPIRDGGPGVTHADQRIRETVLKASVSAATSMSMFGLLRWRESDGPRNLSARYTGFEIEDHCPKPVDFAPFNHLQWLQTTERVVRSSEPLRNRVGLHNLWALSLYPAFRFTDAPQARLVRLSATFPIRDRRSGIPSVWKIFSAWLGRVSVETPATRSSATRRLIG